MVLLCGLCLIALLGCRGTVAETEVTPTPTAPATALATATAVPTATATPTSTPTATSPTVAIQTVTVIPGSPDAIWRTVGPGVEVRSFEVLIEATAERVTVARLDPDRATFRVLYSPGEPHLVSAWAEQSGALLVVNAGYFTPEYHATGLTISDSKAYGVSYGDYAGMFAVSREGAASVRWLRVSPYDPQEPLREAIQCFPVLVKPGGVMGFPADADAGQTTRRTVVAQDDDGRILFLVAQDGYFSLHALAVWLAETDLDIDIALNLDGGPSSGLWLASGPNVDSIVPIPVVIAVTE